MTGDEVEQEPWKALEGEPTYKVATRSGAILAQSMANGLTAAFVMRPEVAIWLGEQLQEAGKLMQSGLTIAHEMPRQNRNDNGQAPK